MHGGEALERRVAALVRERDRPPEVAVGGRPFRGLRVEVREPQLDGGQAASGAPGLEACARLLVAGARRSRIGLDHCATLVRRRVE